MWINNQIRRPAGVSDWKVLFFFLLLACACSFVLLLRVFCFVWIKSTPTTTTAAAAAATTATATATATTPPPTTATTTTPTFTPTPTLYSCYHHHHHHGDGGGGGDDDDEYTRLRLRLLWLLYSCYYCYYRYSCTTICLSSLFFMSCLLRLSPLSPACLCPLSQLLSAPAARPVFVKATVCGYAERSYIISSGRLMAHIYYMSATKPTAHSLHPGDKFQVMR